MTASDRWYIHTEFYPPDICAESDVWSVTKVEGGPGWNTNGGEIGSGLTKADAQFLADAANEKIEREAVKARVTEAVKGDLVKYGPVGWYSAVANYYDEVSLAPGEDPNNYQSPEFVIGRPWVKLR